MTQQKDSSNSYKQPDNAVPDESQKSEETAKSISENGELYRKVQEFKDLDSLFNWHNNLNNAPTGTALRSSNGPAHTRPRR